jgi:pseudaminic acid synthase
VNIFGKNVGIDTLPLIVAELSCNHEGSLNKAKELISQAKEATADAVKIQVYDADDMTINSENEDFYIKDGYWKGRNLHELYKQTGTPYEWLPHLFKHAKSIDMPLFASVFSERGLEALEELNCPAYKIASFELTGIYLIRKVAKTGKPIVISTGMATLDEIDLAMTFCDPANSALLHCISSYPTKLEELNLWRIQQLRNIYLSVIGFSDHTTNLITGALAVAAGARIIEKHMIIHGSNSEDKKFSITDNEFKEYAALCREAATACLKVPVEGEEHSKQFRRSVYAVKDINEGEVFTPENVKCIRPSYGICASEYPKVLCKRAAVAIKQGTALKKEMLS